MPSTFDKNQIIFYWLIDLLIGWIDQVVWVWWTVFATTPSPGRSPDWRLWRPPGSATSVQEQNKFTLKKHPKSFFFLVFKSYPGYETLKTKKEKKPGRKNAKLYIIFYF